MHRSLVKFSESEASNHTPSLADFTTTTPELKFSVHTASFDLLIMTLLLIGSKERLAAIVALQANLDNQRLNAAPTAHFHQHRRALFRRGGEPLPLQPEHGAQPNRSQVFVGMKKFLTRSAKRPRCAAIIWPSPPTPKAY
jgi:hypothetical protein